MSEFDKDWDWYAGLIDSRKESDEWSIIRKTRETHWEEFCQIKENAHVLDAGCGNGDYTRLMLLKGARVWAFDYAGKMVQAAEQRLKREGLKAEKLTVDSVLDIPYPDSMFDAVVCLAVIDHVPDDERSKAVSELARVLKPGGTLYINTPNKYAFHWRTGHYLMRLVGLFPKGKIRWFTPQQLSELVEDMDLVPMRSLGLEFIPPFSGLYTSDLRRRTFLPDGIISILDNIYLNIEARARRIDLFKALCLHYFLVAHKREVQSADI